MSDEAYDKKFTEMQKYLPFLRKIIERLKSSNDIDQDNPRKGQLQKMEMLHGLLTSKEKKLKIETLLKCEGVLKKLHSKMDKSNSSHSQSLFPKSVAIEMQPKSSPVQQNSEIVDITGPSSPPASPTQSAIPTIPVEIPTERCSPITFTDDIPKPTKNASQNSTNSKSKQHHDPKKYNQNIHSHQKISQSSQIEKSMERLSSNNNRSAPQSHTSIWNSSHTPLSSIPTIITTAAKPSPVFRNTEPHVRNFDKHKWYRQNELLVPVIPANSKQHSNIRSHEQMALSDNRKGIDSTYIPDRKWDEFSKADSIKKIDRSNSATRPIPVVDPSYDSPSVQNDPKPFDKLIYQYKHTNTDSSAHNSTERKVFSRLGAKLDNANRTGPFENFSINVKNDRLKTRTTNPLPQQSTASPSIVNSKISPALSIPTTKVTQPPLADVLKSPPLTAIDISNLMNETVCSASEPSSLSSISISGIGTRRPPKSVEPKTFPTTPASSLDYVRKKFAMITKNSPQYSDSPASPPPLNGNVPISNERIALKYNPHPRANRVNSPATGSHTREVPTTNLNEAPCSSFDMPTPAPFNVLPTINLSDPRLKKPNAAAPTHLQSIPSLLNLSPIDIENATSMFVERECMFLGKNYPTAASNSRPYRNETHSATSQNQNNFNYQPASKNNVQYADSPEENWDSDPENPPPTVTVTPKASERVEPAEKNQRVNASKDYSSEENWDSDPEPATVNAKKNQPVVSNINMTSPLKSSSLQPLVTSPSLKADPRYNRGAAVGIDHASIHTRSNINLQTFAYNYIEDSRIPKAFTSPCQGGFGQQNPQQQQLNTNTRFSALMNDKTERMKYFESKKQKHMEPRTYAEFKEAKARAATKEVTATSAAPAASAPPTVIAQAKESVKQNKQNKYDGDKRVKDTKIKNVKGKEFVVPKKFSPPETNLDKLYRGKSFSGSSELPKTIAKFKIPRKHNESKKSGIEGELQKDSSTEKESPNTEEPENVENSKNQYDTKNKCVDKKQGVKLAKNKGTTLDTKITESQEDIQSDNDKSKASERVDTGRKDKKTGGNISDVEHKNKKKNKKSNLKNVEIKKIKSANSEDIQLKKDKQQKNINGNNEEIIDEKSKINNEEILKDHLKSANSEDIKLKNDKEKNKINENYAEIIGEESNINNEQIKHIIKSVNFEDIQLKNNNINDNDTEIIAGKSNINNGEINKVMAVHFEDIQLKKNKKPDKINENYAEKSNINYEEIKYADSEDMALRQDKKHNKIIENDAEIIGELMTNDNILIDSETIATNNDHLKSEDVNQNHEKSSESQVVDEVHVTSEEGDVCKSSKVKTNLSPVKFLSPDAIFKFSNSSLQPQRILRRRCTMISYGSAPEVDKEKINNENALLFEDLHDHQKRLEEAEEIKKRVNRKNRNLAEIFQKTDDNCTVSTQNIISGKRRTRTTVNFNEVQQSLAAFRQNKPTIDVKKEPKDFDEESGATKPPKKENKKVTKKMTKAVRKKNVEDQSSTVSSTTSQIDENSSCSGKVVNKKKALELASDNEPSSSPKSNNPSATLDEDQRKQEFLEKMLQDMNNPNSNHEFIFSLLSQILSQEKFEQVKNILESSAKENILQITTADDAEEAESVVAEEQNDSGLQQSTSPKANTRNNTGKTLGKRTTLKRKRANELDRLNLDIRHMFISEGVITATGRRMCTLAAVGENKPQIAVNKKSEDGSKKSPSTQDYKNTNHIHIRKSKVVISPLNLNMLRRSMRSKNDDESNSGDDVNDENVQTTIVTTRSPTPTDQKDASLYRKMPVLKPNTPIKLVEEEQQLEAIEEKLNLKSPTTAGKKRKLTKLMQSKPCPKSKKPFSVVLPDDSIATTASTEEIAEDSEDDLQLAHLCKRLKSNSSVLSIDNTSQKAEKVILNTNPHWHALSKYSHWCFFCDAKFRHIAIHYKQKHHNAESFPSRIAPTILQQYKQGKLSAPIFGTKSKQQTHWFYRCPFCLQHSRTITRCWLEHFIKHTGEYFFECSECYKTANKTNKIDIHLRNSCPGGKIIRREYQTSTKLIKAHICHMCNFLQLNRINLERHYIEQHGCNPEHVTVLGYSINLFNADGAAVVDEETAAKMEAAAVEKYTQESVVNIDDDDEEQEVHPPGSTEAMKTNEADECLPDSAKASKQSNDTKNVISETYETPSGSAVSDNSIAEKNLSTGSSLNKAATIKLPKKLAKLESAAKKSLLKSIIKKNGSEDKRKLRNSLSSNSSNEASVSKTEDLQTESERIAKFIVDVQDDVLAAAAKAEAEENAREEALRSNIFMPTERSNTDSPTIQCLTESLRTIEQAEEQLQQQQQQSTYTVSNVAGHGNQTSNTIKTSNSSPSISMAERLSQRFKDIKVRTVAEEVPKAALNATSANSSFSESSTSSKNLVIVEDENKKDQDKKEREEEDEDEEYEFGNQKEPKENDTEDDGNWEDIEISECAPSATPTIGNSGKEKQKQKRIYQSIKRLYATINNKKPTNNKKKALVTMFNKKQQQSRNQQTESIKTSDSPTPQATSKVRPLLANLQDLLPDSPCNDPMELVPELAPVEPLQDLNDISSILEANFSALDAQSILQQMDMTITADTICINADGQQQSIQDALEFVTEQQEEQDGGENSVNVFNQLTAAVKISQNQLQTVINRVQNLGYSKNTETGTKFYCISENCSFLFSNESFGLESHFLNEHPHIRWSGFCCICNSQVVEQQGEAPEVFQISQEMQHMLEKHIQKSEESAHQDRDELLRDEEEATTQYSITKFDSMPRIKLRRLTGDCLSTTPTSLSTPEAAESSQPNDLTNISLSDLLRAEPRPVNFKSFLKTQEEHTAMSMAETVKNQTDRDSLPLFKNIGNEFTITSVASGATELGMPLQISTVRSLSDCSQATIASTESTSTLPKISNVCSLNSLGQKSKNSAGSLWQKQIELDRIELKKAEKESRELSRIMHNNLHSQGNPSNDKIGDLFTEAMRDSDSPTLVAETLPVSTATSGEFLITQTISAQYEENVLNGPNSGPQLGINISIAPKTSQVPTNARTTATSVPEEGPATIRPQFKCMGNFCKYQTCVSVAMIEHLRFHERRNFSTQHEYLRCSFCDHFSDDIDLYIKHAVEQHPIQLSLNDSQNATKNVSTKCALTQKIQDILKVNHDGRRSSSSSNSNDTISTTTPAEVPFTQQLLETIKEMVSNTGLPDSKLYRCVIEGCKTALNESSFHTHIIYHLSTLGTINVNNYNYKCPHCKATYQRPTGIKAHIKSHGRHRFFCFQCMGTTNNPAQMLKHFCEKHWKVSTLHTIPMCTTDKPEVASPNNALAQYILAQGEKHLTALDVQQFGEKLIAEWQRKKAAAKTHFKPNEINLLPIQPIFQNEVHCSDCLYKTKVRTNMFRHLQLHKSSTASNGGVQLHMASVDPVNPVPCLNSNERHFDKMCNLASSSVATGTAASATSTKSTFKPPYAYVAEMRRFACGVAGCHYLTVSEEIFRSHLSALHQNLTQYCCPFCKEELCINQRPPAIERILQHLRMHGPKLYQCKECDFLHYLKGFVERHIFDRHAVLRVNLITHERSVDGVAEGTKATQTVTGRKFKEPLGAKPVGFSDSPNNACNPASSVGINTNSTTASSTLPNSKQKWECDLCRHRTGTHNQMIHHCSVQHACKQQYQCVHCQFGSTQLAHIMTHIDEKHPTKTREARYIFHKIFSSAQEKEADTRPLWQRDDPTRVRHIRGILMEDEEESEQFGKRLGLDDENDDEFEEFVSLSDEKGSKTKVNENEIIPNIEKPPTVTLETESSKLFDFGCYHCDFKTENFDKLKNNHWKTAHNSITDVAKPFYFRLLRTLKCAECNTFKGDHNSLQLHMQNAHQTRVYIAADAEESNRQICGYCEFSYTRTVQLIKHYQRVGHKPQDIKKFTAQQLESIKRLGTPETYVQCMLCMDLFANRMAIVEHAHAKHESEDNFSFKELRDQIIYRCAICSFAAADELKTMRHMIDHYGSFKYCYFCRESQTTFNGYMQHCYTEHRQEIKRFSEIYTIKEISKYLQQVFVIFPNGFMINKKNLYATLYGGDINIHLLYKEICKISQEPPIPRLSIARLVARKSIEAKQASRNGSPNPCEADQLQSSAVSTAAALQLASDNFQHIQASKISKRRKTVAFGCRDDCSAESSVLLNDVDAFAVVKKRKVSENILSTTSSSLSIPESVPIQDGNQPYSFYGKKLDTVDLTKIYTNVAIGGLDTPLTIDKFKMLFKIDAQVVVDKLDVEEISKKTEREHAEKYRNVKKACPASQKFKYI